MTRISKKISLLLIAAVLALFSAGSLVAGHVAVAEESQSSAACFVTEDRETQGFWYNGDNGLKANAANRNYGKDGAVLFFHWMRENGQQSLDVEYLNDFTDNSDGLYYNGEKANYVEYPSYVTAIEGNITSINDDPFGYWMNTPRTLDQALNESKNGIQPLPIEGVTHDGEQFTWSHGGFQCAAGSTTEFTVSVSDDEWHRVTYYIGCPWRHKYVGLDTQDVTVYDLDGNVLASRAVYDANQGVYVQFAVKGSFMIQLKGNALAAYSSGLFFDPYVENTEIGTTGLTASLELPRTVNLSWTNLSEETYTSVYRRVKGEESWTFIAEVGKGINAYTDTTANVSTDYEYALASASVFEKVPQFTYTRVDEVNYRLPYIRVKTYNLPDYAGAVEQATAKYAKTRLEFLSAVGYSGERNQPLTVSAKLTKEAENGEYEPYAGIPVTFTLDGDNVYTTIGVYVYENMDTLFAAGTTDEEGIVEVTGVIPYAGEYTVIASTEVQPDEATDGQTGFDAASASAGALIEEITDNAAQTPFLMSVSDAVKPGDTAYITGYNLGDDGNLQIAYARNEGKVPGAFEEHGGRFFYLDESDIIYVDSVNGTGLMFTFPADADAGTYDFYVKNGDGWSNGITMNAVRPLYLDQEGAYEGSKIQIIGRNFMQYEYGVGDEQSSLASLKVRLTQVTDEKGLPASDMSYTLTVANGGILTGNKADASDAITYDGDAGGEAWKVEALQAEDIPYTYSLRITIKIPEVYSFGTYEVTVAADGKDFRQLKDNCKLTVYDRKAPDWNEDVFGAMSGTDNDPLGIGAYWAQDLNYVNVTVMSPDDSDNTFATAAAYTAKVNSAITGLSAAGGGVLYFPSGTYYLFSNVTLRAGIIIAGAGSDAANGTKFVYADNTATNRIWFKADKSAINIGLANVYLDGTDARLQDEASGKWYAPKYVVQWSGEGTGVYTDEDTTITDVKNRFIVNVNADMFAGETLADNECQRNVTIGGKNCVIRDCEFYGILISTELNSYGQMWGVKMVYEGAVETSPHWMGRYVLMENCYFDMQGMGHGPSVKSDQYMAYSYSIFTGNRANPTNDGEVMLMEAPTGSFATGKVLDSTPRTVTLDFTGGTKISSNTSIRYNMCAVYISNGKGAGQYRYIKTAGTGDYTNCYELMDWEKDWDVLPDSTSVFGVIAPLANMTVYHYKAYDCVSSLTFYSNCLDVVIEGCTLVDTAGITGGGLASQGMIGGRVNPAGNIRITGNEISGVGSHAKTGESAASVAQSGGIQVYSGGSGEYMGMLTFGITIKDNYIHDVLPDVTPSGELELGSGLVLYFKGGQNGNANGMRYIIVENNTVENSEWGLYIDYEMVGVVTRNNTVSGTTNKQSDVNIDRPAGYYGEAQHTFCIDGQISDELSGAYMYETLLPEAPAADGKVFYGWTPDENFTSSSVTVTKQIAGAWERFQDKSITNEVLLTYGYGDGGGGPTAEHLECLRRTSAGIDGCPVTEIGGVRTFFERLEPKLKGRAAVWRGELYLEFHRGTYTSMAKNKRLNRKFEYRLTNAEWMSAALSRPYDGALWESLWKKLLHNQFHDILPGSGIGEIYEESDRLYAALDSELSPLENELADGIAAAVSAEDGYLVFNPNGHTVTGAVETDRGAFIVQDVPAKGWKTVAAEQLNCRGAVTVGDRTLENEFLRVAFDDGYCLSSVVDKRTGQEILSGAGNVLQVFDQHLEYEFDAWEIKNYYGRVKTEIRGFISAEKFDEGAVKGFKIVRRYRASTIEQRVYLTEGSAALTFDTRLDWKDAEVMLKADFPVRVNAEYAECDIQFGTVKRPVCRNTSWEAAKFEVCAHKFADLSQGDYGVALMNDCKYGYDFTDGHLRLTLLRTPVDPNPTADIGAHEFRYALYPHLNTFCNSDVPQASAVFNNPLIFRPVSRHNGRLPATFSLVSVDADNVIVDTVKPCEGGFAVRMYETMNKRARVCVRTGTTVKRVYVCDLMENELRELETHRSCSV